MYKAFVYGSLKRGFGNHRVLDGGEFIGHSVTADNNYSMFPMGGFPGVTSDGDKAVIGELYEVDEQGLRRLDQLEGNGHFYTREEVDVVLEDSETIKAWMYLLPHRYNHRTGVGSDRVETTAYSQEWTI